MKKNIHIVLISMLMLALLVLSAGCGSKASDTASSESTATVTPAAVVTENAASPSIKPEPSASPSAKPSADTSAKPSVKPSPKSSAKPSAKPSASPDSTKSKDYDALGSALLDNDGLGSLKLRMSESALVKLMGQPDSKTEAQVWGADGLEHSDWTYTSKGLEIGMAKQPDDTEAVIDSLTATAPCDLATKRGIKLGDTKDAVLTAYKNEINPDANDDTDSWIVIGSVFGGIGIGIENGLVASIFIGASAE
jgi:hypothetical protein